MIVFQIVCLFFSLFVLQTYISKGIHAKNHHLLPVVQVVICVYYFYETLLLLAENRTSLLLLMDLLLIQFIYVLLNYVMDFTQTKLPRIVQYSLFFSLIVFDVLAFSEYADVKHRRKWIIAVILGYAILITIIGVRAYRKEPGTRRERAVEKMIYVAMLAAEIGAVCWRESSVREQMLFSGALLFFNGIIFYLILTDQLVDVSAIMQENMFDTAPNGIILLDDKYYYLAANKAAGIIFEEDLKEEDKTRSFGRKNVPRVAAMLEKGTGELERKDRCYQYRIMPLDYQGKTMGYVLSLWEITDEKRKTRVQREKREFAEEQTRRKSKFLAAMSHDLRSPVHAIMGSCDILMGKRELSARNRSLIQHIKNAGKILLDNVNDILMYSKLEAGKMQLTEEEYSPEELFEELAGICAVNLQSKQVDLTMRIVGEYPVSLLGDVRKVYCILQNLLSNAIKFTAKGEIRCEMFFGEVVEDGRVPVKCVVSDTGRGMTAQQLQHAFEDYASFSGATEEGTGLGLPIVHQLSHLMGGCAKAESDGMHGTVVTVTYKQRAVGGEKRTDFLITKEKVMCQSVLWKENVRPSFVYPDARILLADDMQINRQIFEEMITPWKVQIDCVVDGKAAVEAAKSGAYQMIFLDRMMPKLSGNEAAEQIRQFSEVPLIAVTADLSDDGDEWRRYGFDEFLPKPIDMEELKCILEQLLPEEYRRRSENEPADLEWAQQQNSLRNARTLKTFVAEAEDLKERFREYVESDNELLRTKVHGIKGACRQIGQMSMGETAEIMEMAAKTGNLAFVKRHEEDFLFELEQTIEEIKSQITLLAQNQPEEAKEAIPDKKVLWQMLEEAFRDYDMTGIDRIIEQLQESKLTEQERDVLRRAERCGRDFDYEEGCSLLEAYCNEKEAEDMLKTPAE